jgi:hypothetical protein
VPHRLPRLLGIIAPAMLSLGLVSWRLRHHAPKWPHPYHERLIGHVQTLGHASTLALITVASRAGKASRGRVNLEFRRVTR